MAERPEDLNLPNAAVMRLIKDTLPDGVHVSKEARSAIARAASVFVLYATSTANSLAQTNRKKTVSGQDVLDAIKDMEFTQFVEPLKDSLAAFKASQLSKKTQKGVKAKAKKGAKDTQEDEDAPASEGDKEAPTSEGDKDAPASEGDKDTPSEGEEREEVMEVEEWWVPCSDALKYCE